MKPDYRNWVPKNMLSLLAFFAFLCFVITFLMLWLLEPGVKRVVWSSICLVVAVSLTENSLWMTRMYRAFSYDGNRKLSKGVVEGLASYVKALENGLIFDVGCGSGALTIAVAKRNPAAKVIGIDRWGKEYGSYSKNLCERNAKLEGVDNVEFRREDAVKLDFPDESFDAVTSNYVYHNISGINRQELLVETLRLVKKGGTFAIHDIFSKGKYGDMQSFIRELEDMGYENIRLIDTTDGVFMTRKEATKYSLSHSATLLRKRER
jgi:arsenite methyltransferase